MNFDTSAHPIKCYFIDNSLNEKDEFDDAEDDEKVSFFKVI